MEVESTVTYLSIQDTLTVWSDDGIFSSGAGFGGTIVFSDILTGLSAKD